MSNDKRPRIDHSQDANLHASLPSFKNVSLGNVMSAKAPNEEIPFIKEKDLDLYRKYRDASFEVQVGLHELTGTARRDTKSFVQNSH